MHHVWLRPRANHLPLHFAAGWSDSLQHVWQRSKKCMLKWFKRCFNYTKSKEISPSWNKATFSQILWTPRPQDCQRVVPQSVRDQIFCLGQHARDVKYIVPMRQWQRVPNLLPTWCNEFPTCVALHVAIVPSESNTMQHIWSAGKQQETAGRVWQDVTSCCSTASTI